VIILSLKEKLEEFKKKKNKKKRKKDKINILIENFISNGSYRNNIELLV